MNFLTARWSHLILVNYAVDPELLRPHLPRGTEPDLLRGEAFVSLVAFHFLDTRVLGVKWPGYVNFTEINLRFYVRAGADRGVVFVREYVPHRLIATAARLTYNEPYRAAPMEGKIHYTPDTVSVSHRLHLPQGTQYLDAWGRTAPETPAEDSDAHWFKEQRWGFGTDHFGRTLRYEVVHPTWRIFPIETWRMAWNWEAAYGPKWAPLQQAKAHSILLAEGSEVAVKVHGRVG